MQKKIELSEAQQDILVLETFIKEKGVFNIPLVYDIKGKLSISALTKAFTILLNRHEILRLKVENSNGEYKAYISEILGFQIEYLKIDKNISKQALSKYINIQVQDYININTDIPIKCKLISLDEVNYILIITFHHIVVDDWSIGIILEELNTLYNAASDGTLIDKDNAGVPQYFDYIHEQKHNGATQLGKNCLNYWHKFLQASDVGGSIISSKTNNLLGLNEADEVLLEISGPELTNLENLGYKSRSTIFNLLITGLYCVLSLVGDNERPVIGFSASNRDTDKHNDIVGLFVKMLPYRLNVSGEKSYLDYVKESRIQIIDHIENQDFKFEDLLKMLQIEKTGSENPIFQVLFAYASENKGLSLNHLQIHQIPIRARFTKLPLTIFCSRQDSKLQFKFVYSKAKFEKCNIEGLVKAFQNFLSQAVVDYDKPICEIDLIAHYDNASSSLSIVENKDKHFLSNMHIISLIEQNTVNNSDKIAIIHGKKKYSYHELLSTIYNLSSYFREKYGAKPLKILLALEASFDYIAAFLSALYSGYTVVPVSKSLPNSRINTIFNQVNPEIIICDEEFEQKLDIKYKGSKNIIRITPNLLSTQSNTKALAVKNEIAVIIFTSGSTGTPKGVLCTHDAILNRVLWHKSVYPVSQSDVSAFLADISFVDSIGEIILPLINGSTIVVPEDAHTRIDPDKLTLMFENNNITRATLIPSYLSALINSHSSLLYRLHSLRHLEVSGENFYHDQILQVLNNFQDIKVINRYGASEATSIIYNELSLDSTKDFGYKVTSRIISDTSVGGFNKHLKLLPNGLVGEIFVCGQSVTPRYFNEATNQDKFITNKTINALLQRGILYKIGDLGIIKEDKSVKILSRADNLLKINGFRIEPREIELSINGHPQVKESIVIGKSNENTKELVCFIVPIKMPKTSNEEKLIQSVRKSIELTLPMYMLPSEYHLIKEIPRTSSGKIDYVGLNNYQTTNNILNSRKFYTLPRNFKEFKIGLIWQEVLGHKNFDIDDDFFTIGGNSISVIKVIAKMQHIFNIKINYVDIYKNKSIAKIASLLSLNPETTLETDIMFPLSFSSNKSDTIFLIHPAPGFSFPYLSLAINLSEYNIVGINDPSLTNNDINFDSIKEMAELYANKILKYQPAGHYIIGGWSFGGCVALEIARLLVSKGFDVKAVLMFDSSLRPKESYLEWTESEIFEDITGMGLNPYSIEGKKIIEVMKRNGMLLKNYEPAPYSGRVILFKAQDEECKTEFRINDFFQGWLKPLKNNLEIASIKGNHKGLFTTDNAAYTAKVLKLILESGYLRQIIQQTEVKDIYLVYLEYANTINDRYSIRRLTEIITI